MQNVRQDMKQDEPTDLPSQLQNGNFFFLRKCEKMVKI